MKGTVLMKCFLTKSIYLLAMLFCISTNARSQCAPKYTFTGETAWDQFSSSVASAGDINNDGYDDIIIGAPFNSAEGTWAGRVYVFSGLTGDTLYEYKNASADDRLGFCVASAGDVNSDGWDDIIFSAPTNDGTGANAGRAYVVSGQTGDTLYVFSGEQANDQLGISVASAGDVNNDNFDDVIIGAYRNDANGIDAGRAYIFSGQTGDTLYIFGGEAADDRFGTSVASAGDVNNDGFGDVIIGSVYNDGTGSNAGRAYVFSGQTGGSLYVFSGEAADDNFGFPVTSAGDVNRDGFDDLIIGADYNDGSGIDAGRAYVFSGQTGDTLYVFGGESAEDHFGFPVSSAGDVDSDGYADLMIGATANDAAGQDAGRVYLFSGRNGDTIHVFTGTAEFEYYGASASSAGDVNKDGCADLIIGSPFYNAGGGEAGGAFVFTGCGCCVGKHGDVNGDGSDANVVDLTFIIDRLFRGGVAASCALEADANGDGTPSNILDLTFLIDRIFRGGPAPGTCY